MWPQILQLPLPEHEPQPFGHSTFSPSHYAERLTDQVRPMQCSLDVSKVINLVICTMLSLYNKYGIKCTVYFIFSF
jgi:hypothetical protein